MGAEENTDSADRRESTNRNSHKHTHYKCTHAHTYIIYLGVEVNRLDHSILYTYITHTHRYAHHSHTLSLNTVCASKVIFMA